MILNFLPPKILDRFTSRAKKVFENLECIAKEYPILNENKGQVVIGPGHLLFSLFKQEGGMARNILRTHKIESAKLIKILENNFYEKTFLKNYKFLKTRDKKIFISPELKKILKKAVAAATSFGHNYIGTEHILYAALSQSSNILGEQDSKKIKEHLKELLSSSLRFPEVLNVLNPHKLGLDFMDEKLLSQKRRKETKEKTLPKEEKTEEAFDEGEELPTKLGALNYFCEDVSEKAEKGLLDPLIGRKKEVNRLIYILVRRTKNNPLLVGDPGVGKTAIVNGLAQKIAKAEVPEMLLRKKIYSLDLGLLVSGTMFRGEFEARLKDLLYELKKTKHVLFIDEFHNIIGAGSAQGSLDAANILKPALSKGEIQCIGATTFEEYKKYVERDAALERRFQPIFIKEEGVTSAIKILKGLKKVFEKHHGLKIKNEAIEAAVKLSSRYIQDRFLPDKAIDLLDETASRKIQFALDFKDFKKLKGMEQTKTKLASEKEMAIKEENYEKALKLRGQEEKLKQEIKAFKKISRHTKKPEEERWLSEEDVAKTLSEITGVPFAKLEDKEIKFFKTLSQNISQKIVGQKEAVEAISYTLKRARSGLGDPSRPFGSFIFLGPTGVGKTELAKVVAQELSSQKLSGEEDNLIKLDMSEFSEPHSISKIIGAPPGYVGYEDGSRVIEKIRRNPYTVVLLDEIEKAHPQIFNILLQVLEDGELTTASGKKVNFKNTILIMTSNIGTEEFTREAVVKLGFEGEESSSASAFDKSTADKKATEDKIKEKSLKELREIMRPELLNRVDKIIFLNPLDFESVKKIVKLQIRELQKRMPNFKLMINPEVLEFLIKESFNPKEGARLVRRKIEELVENPLADMIIDGKIMGREIRIELKKDKIVIE